MTRHYICKGTFSNFITGILGALLFTGLLTSCSTESNTAERSFRFRVLCYRPPVETRAWVPSLAATSDPDGAALDIVDAMAKGDLTEWLSYWQASDRPAPGPEQQQAILRHWQTLYHDRVNIIGRVVAGPDIVVELALINARQEEQRIQIPLRKQDDRWWMIQMDPASEFLHWEESTNKIVDYIDPAAFQKHLQASGM